MTQPAATQWITLCDGTDEIPFSGAACKMGAATGGFVLPARL